MDNLSPQHRSATMSHIKAKNTQPEMIVRKMVFAMGRRYRLHVRELAGSPDLVFPRDRKLIFVHGCFWHQHARCAVASMPRSRLAYWRPKLEGNRKRDLRNQRRLRRAGWTLLTIRECQLRDLAHVQNRVENFLRDPVKTGAATASGQARNSFVALETHHQQATR